MNDSILEALYNGQICPADKCNTRTDEYNELSRQIIEEQKYFKSTLLPKEWNKLDELMGIQLEQSALEHPTIFTYGFRLGAKMMLDVIAK